MDVPQKELERLADAGVAAVSQRFFKTGPGQYGAGDRFRGIRVPVLRKLARTYQGIGLAGAGRLLCSEFHEDRLLALLILVRIFAAADETGQKAVYHLYLAHTHFINNWDLVDASAEQILGAYLRERDRGVLRRLARSSSLWERRMAIVATFHFIKNGDFDATLRIAQLLLADPHDLIHKAVGWMLREVGKRDLAVEEGFLKAHYRTMPRTMLRYAIERFPDEKRRAYLRGSL
jgi:3-methyladenine DNA glycosylase AlkD